MLKCTSLYISLKVGGGIGRGSLPSGPAALTGRTAVPQCNPIAAA